MSEVAKEVKQKMIVIAKKHDREVIELDMQAEQAPMRRGWLAVIMETANEFQLLGFEDEKSYWKARGISRSSWYRYKKIAQGFAKKLKLSEFLEMAAGKAELLAQYLGDEDRVKDTWLRKAAKKNTRITEDELKAELERMNPKERGKQNDDDLRATWKIRGYEPQLAMIDDTIRQFAKENKIEADDKALVLEMICTEVRHGASVIAAIRDTVPEVRTFMALLDGSDKPAEEQLDELVKRVETLVVRLAKAAGVKLTKPDVKAKAAAAGPALVTV